MSDNPIDRAIEEAPLLAGTGHFKKRMPLPKHQICIVLLLDICEPITICSIYPYINAVSSLASNLFFTSSLMVVLQLILELDITGGDEKEVGYYAGLIVNPFSSIRFPLLHPRSGISILCD